jgi:hypothetical protein
LDGKGKGEKMPIKNYSTTIGVEQTIAQIEKILAKHGARAILKEYDVSGRVTAVNFIAEIFEGKSIPFRLPLDVQALMEVINHQIDHPNPKEGRIGRKYKNDMDYARRVGWRIIRDWVDAQMTMIDLKQVSVPQVFLSYAYDSTDQKTFFQKMSEGKFKNLPLLDK